MKDQFIQFVLFGFMLVTTVHLRSNRNSFEENIIFHGYDQTGHNFTTTLDSDVTLLQYCISTDNVTIITHGWKEESARSAWVRQIISNFSSVRGGCVFYMNYEYYSRRSYLSLYSNFKPISEVLTKKLAQLNQLGFDPGNYFLFGFSFGAHLMLDGAYKFGPRKVGRIDCCDPAGPLFPEYFGPALHAHDSATFVQCIHTSSDKGTNGRYCPVDINMGKCGHIQPVSRPQFSHGLCPVAYINAFNVDFKLVSAKKVEEYFRVRCVPKKNVPDVKLLPNGTMGFRFNTSFPLGEYFALTKATAPYNVV